MGFSSAIQQIRQHVCYYRRVVWLYRYLAAYERVNRLDLDVEQTEEDDVGALGMSLSKRRSVQGSLGSLMSSYNSSPG